MTGAEHNQNGDERLWARVRPVPQDRLCPGSLELAAYIDGRLEAAPSEAVEAHLAACQSCLDAVGEARSLSFEPAPPAVVERARALVGLAGPRLGGLARVGRAVAWPMAAAASIAVCVVGYRVGAGAAAVGGQAGDAALAEMTFGVFESDSEWLADELLPPPSLEDLP